MSNVQADYQTPRAQPQGIVSSLGVSEDVGLSRRVHVAVHEERATQHYQFCLWVATIVKFDGGQ